jgi:hypothetical protein
MPDKKWLYLPPATSPRDYPESMSQYERESLAAEAKLAEERKSTERLKPSQERARRSQVGFGDSFESSPSK